MLAPALSHLFCLQIDLRLPQSHNVSTPSAPAADDCRDTISSSSYRTSQVTVRKKSPTETPVGGLWCKLGTNLRTSDHYSYYGKYPIIINKDISLISLSLSIYLSISISISPLNFVSLNLCQFSLCLSLCLSSSLSVSLYFSLCPSLPLYVSLRLSLPLFLTLTYHIVNGN